MVLGGMDAPGPERCRNMKVTITPTDLCSDAVSLAVEKSSDLHQFTVPLDSVVDHRRLHEEGVVSLHRPLDALL